MTKNTQKYVSANLQPGILSGRWGCADSVSSEGIRGWFIDLSAPFRRFTVSAYVDGTLVASGETDTHRQDISSLAGVEACCGFILDWNNVGLSQLAESTIGSIGKLCVQVEETEDMLHTIAEFNLEQVLSWARKAIVGNIASKLTLTDERNTVYFYPDYTRTNPYQRLLAASVADNLCYLAGTIDQAILAAVQNAERKRIVFHLHWTTPILGDVRFPSEAERKKNIFLKKINTFLAAGGIFLWTVHNVVGHENSPFKEVETTLCTEIARLATWIHIHSRKVLPQIEASYALEYSKIVEIPHPHYVGVYPNQTDAVLSRSLLGIPQDRFVFSFIGQLRPYKGLDDLIRAMVRLQNENPKVHLLLAGSPVYPYRKGTVKAMASTLRNVTVVEAHLPDNELQWYYNASDVVVLPYKNILTSGSVLNALSFSVPVIAPDLGAIGDVLHSGKNGLLYDPEKDNSLRDALETAASLEPQALDEWRENALQTVLPYTWKAFGQEIYNIISHSATHESVRRDIGVFGTLRSIEIVSGPKRSRGRPQTAVIVLNYMHPEDTQRLAASLLRSAVDDYLLIVVDNASPNMTLNDLHQLPGDVHIRTSENLGYAGGNNVGIAYALELGAEYIWILNPDITVSLEAHANLLEAAQSHPDCSVFGSVICFEHDRDTVWFAGGEVNFSFGLQVRHLWIGNQRNSVPNKIFETEYVTGASLFCRSEIFSKYSSLPEEYFLYFEETDWCLRLRQQGERLLVVPSSLLFHSKRSEENALPARHYFYYYIRNSFLFTQRFSPETMSASAISIHAMFVTPWLEKISASHPELTPVYRQLAETAVQDGLAGITGKRDISAITFALEHGNDLTYDGPYHLQIDTVSEENISGWAISESNPSAKLRVSLFVDSNHWATVRADSFRHDLASAHIRDGDAAFTIIPPKFLADGRPHHLQFYVEGMLCVEERIFLTIPKYDYAGRIDGITEDSLKGWALNHCDPCEAVEIAVTVDNEIVATGVCSLFRSDLLSAKIGYGSHGFKIPLPKYLLSGTPHTFSINVLGIENSLFERTVSAPDVIQSASSLCEDADELFFLRKLSCLTGEPHLLEKRSERFKQMYKAAYHFRPQNTLVSVIMPAYNREKTILQALESVLKQSYRNIELIIVDDGSDDATLSVVREWLEGTGNPKFVVFELKENRGVSFARNVGLRHASGEIIAYLDSDNTWDEDYLLIMVNALLDAPHTTSAYCGQEIWHCVTRFKDTFEEKIEIRTGPFWLSLLDNKNYIDLNCYIHRSSLVKELGGFAESMRRLVDWELIHRYAVVKAPIFVPALLSHYYMGRAKNQITIVDSYKQNLVKMQQAIGQNYMQALERIREQVSIDMQNVSVLICFPPNGLVYPYAIDAVMTDCFAPQCQFVMLAENNSPTALSLKQTYGSDKRLFFHFYEKGESPSEMLRQLLLTGFGKHGIALLSPAAAPEPGALMELFHAFSLNSKAKLAVSTRLVPVRHLQSRTAQLSSHSPVDITPHEQWECFIHEHTTNDHLTELTKAKHFFTLIHPSVLEQADLSTIPCVDFESFVLEIGELIQTVLHGKILHAGRARVRDMAERG